MLDLALKDHQLYDPNIGLIGYMDTDSNWLPSGAGIEVAIDSVVTI